MTKLTCLPPRRFRAAGVVEEAYYSTITPSFVQNAKKTGRRAEGVRYEAKVHKELESLCGGMYVANPWLRFREIGGDRFRWCQPDALLFDYQRGQITIIECKLQHTADAWWQLRWLYHPVIAKMYPGDLWKIALIEVVKWFDPATAFPETVRMRKSVFDAQPGEIGVHILKP